jgi:hypothetical protein
MYGMKNSEVNKNWKFWKPIITKKNGEINVTQLKKELSDFSHILSQVPAVYCHITDNILSKPNYEAGVVISMADEREEIRTKRLLNDFLHDMRKAGKISVKTSNTLIKEFEKY